MFCQKINEVFQYWNQNKMIKIKWSWSTVLPKGFHSNVAIDSSQSKIPRPALSGRRRWEKKQAKGGGIVRWGTWRLHGARHTCACPSLPPSPTSRSYYFPFPYPSPRRGGLPRLFYSLSLRRVISSLLYTVPRNHICELQHCKARKRVSWLWRNPLSLI